MLPDNDELIYGGLPGFICTGKEGSLQGHGEGGAGGEPRGIYRTLPRFGRLVGWSGRRGSVEMLSDGKTWPRVWGKGLMGTQQHLSPGGESPTSD